MKLKEEKGITSVDITVSVVLIAVFITMITVISNNLQANSKKLERETQGLYYAIDTIETIKSQNFDVFPTAGNNKIQGVDNLKDGYIVDKTGKQTSYYRTIIVQDYTELGHTDKQPEILKKITVEISYKDGNQPKSITLSTIRTKED